MPPRITDESPNHQLLAQFMNQLVTDADVGRLQQWMEQKPQEVAPNLDSIGIAFKAKGIHRWAICTFVLSDTSVATQELKGYLTANPSIRFRSNPPIPSRVFIGATIHITPYAINEYGLELKEISEWLGEQWVVNWPGSSVNGEDFQTRGGSVILTLRTEGLITLSAEDNFGNRGQIQVAVYDPASIGVSIQTIVGEKPVLSPDVQTWLEAELAKQKYRLKALPDDVKTDALPDIRSLSPMDEQLPATIITGKAIIAVEDYKPETSWEGDAKVKAGWKTARVQIRLHVYTIISGDSRHYSAAGERSFPESDAIHWALKEAYDKLKGQLLRGLVVGKN